MKKKILFAFLLMNVGIFVSANCMQGNRRNVLCYNLERAEKLLQECKELIKEANQSSGIQKALSMHKADEKFALAQSCVSNVGQSIRFDLRMKRLSRFWKNPDGSFRSRSV